MKLNINYLYYAAMAGLIVAYAYTKGWIMTDFQSITPQEAYIRIHKDRNATLLDVRTIEEYNYGHIDGASLIPLDTLKEKLSKLPKNKPIIVYCQSGNRSVSASRILKKSGYTPLNLKGGYLEWRREKLDMK